MRRMLGEFNAPVDYSRLRMMLKCDFLALTLPAQECRQREAALFAGRVVIDVLLPPGLRFLYHPALAPRA